MAAPSHRFPASRHALWPSSRLQSRGSPKRTELPPPEKCAIAQRAHLAHPSPSVSAVPCFQTTRQSGALIVLSPSEDADTSWSHVTLRPCPSLRNRPCPPQGDSEAGRCQVTGPKSQSGPGGEDMLGTRDKVPRNAGCQDWSVRLWPRHPESPALGKVAFFILKSSLRVFM